MTDLRLIPNHEPYLAGDDGLIYSTHWHNRPRALALHPDAKGYLRAQLFIAGVKVGPTVHSLIARTYLGPRPDGLQVRHLNGDQTDNRPTNLEYGTGKQNMDDRERHGRTPRGETSALCRYSDAIVQRAMAMAFIDRLGATEIASALGIGRVTVQSWITGRARSHSHAFQTPHGRRLAASPDLDQEKL